MQGWNTESKPSLYKYTLHIYMERKMMSQHTRKSLRYFLASSNSKGANILYFHHIHVHAAHRAPLFTYIPYVHAELKEMSTKWHVSTKTSLTISFLS